MNLQDDLIKSFTQAINQSGGEKSGEKTVYAEVVRIENGVVKIRIDGSDLETPATSMVEVGVGDRVFATIKGHSVVITGNISFPSLTRVGDVYITLTADGLVIGRLDQNNNPVGYRILITPNDIQLVDEDGVAMSVYGRTIRLGKNGSFQLDLSSTGMNLLDKNGNTVASYGTTITLGYTSSSYLYITDTSISNVSIDNWAVYRVVSRTSGAGVVAELSFAADLEGGGGIYVGGSTGFWGLHFTNTEAVFGPSSTRWLRIPVASASLPTIGGTKLAMVGDYVKYVSHTISSDTIGTGTATKITISFTPSTPTGYTCYGVTYIYISNDDWAVGQFYLNQDSPPKIVIKIHTVDGNSKSKPNSVTVKYLIVRTS